MTGVGICIRSTRMAWFLTLCGALPVGAARAQIPTDTTQAAPDLEEILVTGSHIHGAAAAGSTLIVIGREQIDASGYGRIEDVLANVSQNFNRTNAAVHDGDDAHNYLNRGSEVQLRGLGEGTTLTLVNGQRQGASGYQGSFIDVSSIPASAVERIEILPEGASALYGSDAIGGVVNIILRKDFEGFEARVRAASAHGDASEGTIAVIWGHVGSHGRVLLGLQYDDSRPLACSSRARCAANGDFRRFGGSDLRTVGGNPGTIVDPLSGAPIAAIPHGQDGSTLTASQLIRGGVNYTNDVVDNDILPQQSMRSAFLSTAYNLSRYWELSVDGRYSSREFQSTFPQPVGNYFVPAGNAFNHLGGAVVVAYDLTPDLGPIADRGRTETSFIASELKGVLSEVWQLRLSAAYSRSQTDFYESNTFSANAVNGALSSADPATALNLFGDGSHSAPATLATLRNQSITLAYPSEVTTTIESAIADGTLLTVPAGPVRLAVGGDFRTEQSVGFSIPLTPETRRRDSAAVFAELAVPLAAARAASTPDRLSLSLAGRYDHYSDAGDTFNPKVGLTWHPSNALALRGNWGTSFRAPPFIFSNPDQIGDVLIEDVSDPKSATGRSRVLALFGPLKDQKPETSTAWSVGADVAIWDLSLSTTYFDIDYRDKIHPPGAFESLFLSQEAYFASVITRNPNRAQIDAVCSDARLVPGSIGNCSQPIAAILDDRFRNLAGVRTRGVDLALDYAINSAHGRWDFGLNGTYTLLQDQQITPQAPVFDFVDTVGSPLRLRMAAHLSWSKKGWTALATINHTGAYQDPGTVPARAVSSWTTVDLNVGYRVDGGKGWLADTHCNLGVNNLFNQAPPFVNQYDQPSGNLGYDATNASLLGRQISLQLVKRLGR